MRDGEVVNLIQSGFIEQYMKLTEGTESPAKFHLLTAMTLIGTVLGRKAYMNMGMFKIYPNIYAVLVAPTGRCRKSTAIKIAMDILRKAEIANIKIIGPKITPEALLNVAYREVPEIVATEEGRRIVPSYPDSVNLIYVPELAVMLDKRDYNAGLVPMLTDLFDCPDEWKENTIGRGEVTLRNIFVSTMFASTQRWLKQLLPRSAFAGGFMGRLFVSVMENSERCFPTPTVPNASLVADTILKLQRIAELRCEYIWTRSTEKWFAEWYMQNKEALERSFDEREASYLERKQITLIKTAIILAANELRTELTVEDFKMGLSIINMYEKPTMKLFREIEGNDSVDADILTELLGFFRHKRGIATHKEVMKFMQHKGILRAKATEALLTLAESGAIEIRTDGVLKIYKLTEEE